MLKVHLAHSQQNRGNQPCWNYLQIQFMQSIHVSGTLFLIPAHGNLIAKFEPLSGYLSFFKDFMDGKRIQWGPTLLQGLTTILTFSECKTWEPRKTWPRQSERIDSWAASFTGIFKLYSSLTQKVSAMCHPTHLQRAEFPLISLLTWAVLCAASFTEGIVCPL